MVADRQRIHPKRDRLRQLRAFCRAARLQSFVRAAEELGITSSAVSAHVRELEHELEIRLFERSASSVSLTSAGDALFAIAEPLVEGMDTLADDLVESVHDTISGWFEMAATAVAASFVLPAHIKRFRNRHSGIRVRVRSCLFRDGIKLVLDDEVGFLLGAKDLYPPESIEYQELLTYPMVLVTPLDHPLAERDMVSPKEVVQWPAVSPPAGFYTWELEEAIRERCGIETDTVVEVRGWEGIKRYVERGFGISMIPRICVSKTDRLSVVSLPASFPTMSFGVFKRRDSVLDPPSRRFISLMSRNLPSFTLSATQAG